MYRVEIEYDYNTGGRHVIRRYCVIDATTRQPVHKGIVKKSTALIVAEHMNAQAASAPNFDTAAQEEINRLTQIVAGLRSVIAGMSERQERKTRR